MVTKPIDKNLVWRKFWDAARQISYQFGKPKPFFMVISEADINSPRPFVIEGAVINDLRMSDPINKKNLSEKVLKEYLKREYSSMLIMGVPYEDENTMVGFQTVIGQKSEAFASRFKESEFGYNFQESFSTCPELDMTWAHSPSSNIREIINGWFPTYKSLKDSEGKDGVNIWNL